MDCGCVCFVDCFIALLIHCFIDSLIHCFIASLLHCFNWVHIERFWADSRASIWVALDNALAFRVFWAFRTRLARITALVAVYIAFLIR